MEAEEAGQGNRNDWRVEHLVMKGKDEAVHDVADRVEAGVAEGGADMQAALDDIPWEAAGGWAAPGTHLSATGPVKPKKEHGILVTPLEAMDAQDEAVRWNDTGLEGVGVVGCFGRSNRLENWRGLGYAHSAIEESLMKEVQPRKDGEFVVHC